MTLEVHLVLLEPADVELLSRSSTLELSRNVLFVVANDSMPELARSPLLVSPYSPCDKTRCADTLSSLSDKELASRLDRLVDVITLVSAVGEVIVSNVVELVFLKKLGGDDPRAVLDHFVDPFAVSNGFGSLAARHDRQALAPMCFLIASDADNEHRVRESLLGLLEDSHMSEGIVSFRSLTYTTSYPGSQARNLPKMEEVKDSIGVYPNGSSDRRVVGPVASGGMDDLSDRRRRHGFLSLLLLLRVLDGDLAAFTTDSLRDVDARLGGVAGLTGVGKVVVHAKAAIRVGPLALRNRPVVKHLGLGGRRLLARSITRRVLESVGDVD